MVIKIYIQFCFAQYLYEVLWITFEQFQIKKWMQNNVTGLCNIELFIT